MIQITKDEFEKVKEAGLLNDSKGDRNFVIINKFKKSKRKKYFVAETPNIKSFLRKIKDERSC